MKKFNDELNTAVMTTKHVLHEGSPILSVFHYEDGFWQFSGSEDDLDDEDFKIVSLEEIINIDSSVLEVSDLPYGGEAHRKDVNSPWIPII